MILVSLVLYSYHPALARSKHSRTGLRFHIIEEPSSLDPRRGGDLTSSKIQFLLFEGLTQLHQDGSVSLAQAHDIKISKDKKTYTFFLGRTRWSNGEQVTSHDFEKAWKDILSPNSTSANAHLFYMIEGAMQAKQGLIDLSEVGIHTPDDKTLIVKLEKPTPYFLALISFCSFYPIPSQIEDKHPCWATNSGPYFVSNGAYTLATWKHQNELILKKNLLFRDPEKVCINHVHVSVISSEQTALQMFENGELDLLSPIPTEALKSQKNRAALHTAPSTATTLISLNTLASPLSNRNLRKALAYSLNRNLIVNHISELDETVATDFVPPIMKQGKNLNFYIDYQHAMAQEYLKLALIELGMNQEDLNELTLVYTHSENQHKIAQELQQQWMNTLGICIRLQSMESKTVLSKLAKKNYSLALTSIRSQYFDPLSFLERFKFKENIKNYPSWDNVIYQKILDESAYFTGNERLQLLIQAEKHLMEEFPIIPLYHHSFNFLSSELIENFEFSPCGGLFIERLKIKESFHNSPILRQDS